MDIASLSLLNFEESILIERKIKEFLVKQKSGRIIENWSNFEAKIRNILSSINLDDIYEKSLGLKKKAEERIERQEKIKKLIEIAKSCENMENISYEIKIEKEKAEKLEKRIEELKEQCLVIFEKIKKLNYKELLEELKKNEEKLKKSNFEKKEEDSYFKFKDCIRRYKEVSLKLKEKETKIDVRESHLNYIKNLVKRLGENANEQKNRIEEDYRRNADLQGEIDRIGRENIELEKEINIYKNEAGKIEDELKNLNNNNNNNNNLYNELLDDKNFLIKLEEYKKITWELDRRINQQKNDLELYDNYNYEDNMINSLSTISHNSPLESLKAHLISEKDYFNNQHSLLLSDFKQNKNLLRNTTLSLISVILLINILKKKENISDERNIVSHKLRVLIKEVDKCFGGGQNNMYFENAREFVESFEQGKI